jgi:hypothetical protein
MWTALGAITILHPVRMMSLAAVEMMSLRLPLVCLDGRIGGLAREAER